MITKSNIIIIRSMLLQSRGNKLVSIPVSGASVNTNFKVGDYTLSLLTFYQKQYSQAHPEMVYKGKHKGQIGLSRIVHLMTKYFGKEEPWIFRDEKFDKHKYDADLLYALKCVKKIFDGYVPDVRIRTQSDTVLCLIGYHLARLREKLDGEETRGFVDFYDDDGSMEPKDGIEDYSKIGKIQANKLVQPVITFPLSPIVPAKPPVPQPVPILEPVAAPIQPPVQVQPVPDIIPNKRVVLRKQIPDEELYEDPPAPPFANRFSLRGEK